jgi:amino acid adenylation domain-containing protein
MIESFNTSKISVANSEQQVDGSELLTDTKKHKLLVEWNNTTSDYPQDKCIHELFEATVERTPEAVAVVFEGEQLTYRELNARANQLAHYLQERGVGPEVLVGICVERSLEMIVGLLGILKAGGAYVPLDPAYPFERLSFMLEDSSVPVLLTQSKLIEKLPPHSARVVYLDKDWEEIVQQSKENPSRSVTPDNLAYVIYTSGSTGKPKGVCCCHTGVVNLYTDFQSKQPLSVGDRCSLWTAISFDVSVYEIFSALLAGGALYIVSNNVRSDTQTFLDWLNFYQIHSAYIPPFMLNQLSERVLQGTDKFSLRRLLVGVEPIPARLLTSLSKGIPGLHIINGYGPTETTICATLYSVSSFELRSGNTPIGRPVLNTKIYLLNEQMQPVPIGVPGEIHIGGVGLARGYLNRPDLTEQKFIPNPFSDESGSRLYKTGDLARYLPDGNIEFIGRIDNQVKIRGFRIELGEIEAVLSQHPEVLETVVVARQDVADRKYLVGYIVPSDDRAISRRKLRDFLQETLPDYMIPGVFVMLDALPLTPNGKVDRQAVNKYSETTQLKEPETNISNLKMDVDTQNQQNYTGLKTTQLDSIRSTLRSLVAKLLQIEVDEIDSYATFLDMGTDSLLLLEAMRKIQLTFGVQVEAQQFFEELATIEALATYIEQNQSLEREQKSSHQPELYPLSVTQKPASESGKSPQQLAQTKTFNTSVSVPKDKAMNRPDENVEPEPSVKKIISQQLQLMSQQLELLCTEGANKERSQDEKTRFTEFASPKSFDRSATVTHSSPVCSYNEWDPLEEVIVGIVDGAMVPSWHTIIALPCFRSGKTNGELSQADRETATPLSRVARSGCYQVCR